ncbi:UDP-glucose 4-epimerase, partial [Pseudomonas syringae pv. actinidiae ICMP 18804]
MLSGLQCGVLTLALHHASALWPCNRWRRTTSGNETSTEPDQAYFSANVTATLNLAEQAAAAGVKRFIFISSIKASGESTPPG